MRVLCIAAFLTIASCAEKMTLGSGVGMILEQLQAADFEGGSRGMGAASGTTTAVNLLLNQLATEEAYSPAMSATLERVVELLNTILKLLMDDKNTEQTNLDAVANTTAACVIERITKIEDDLEAEDTAAADKHFECRANQSTFYNTVEGNDGACRNLVSDLGTKETLDCSIDLEADQTLGGSWVSKLLGFQEWFGFAQGVFDEHKATCEQNLEDYVLQEAQCKHLQQRYESVRCAYTDWTIHRCIAEGNCYASAVATHNTLKALIFEEANKRVADANLVNYVKCLVQYLITHNNTNAPLEMDAMTGACLADKNGDYSDYNNTDPEIPAQASCVPTVFNPDSDDWYSSNNTAYAGIDPVGSTLDNNDITCGLSNEDWEYALANNFIMPGNYSYITRRA